MKTINGEVLFAGLAIGRVVLAPAALQEWRGRVVVLTTPDWRTMMSMVEDPPVAAVMLGGSRVSHAALLLSSLRVPAVVVDADSSVFSDGDCIIIDAHRGEVILEVESPLEVMERLRADLVPSQRSDVTRVPGQPIQSRDGVGVRLGATINGVQGAIEARQASASEVGLLRTEFLPALSRNPASVEVHLNALNQVFVASHPLSVGIRLLDVGAEKNLPWVPEIFDRKDILGVRGVRFYREPSFAAIINAQLEALAELSKDTDFSLIVPFVTHSDELRDFRQRFKDVLNRIDAPVGCMIEVPSICYELHELKGNAAFCALGLNDLSQFFFAVDRRLGRITDFASPYARSLLRFLAFIAESADPGLDVRVCGQMVLLPYMMGLLMGLGFCRFSIDPTAIPTARRIIEAVVIEELKAKTRELLRSNFTVMELARYLDDKMAG